jgi:hypothetical protein
MKSEQLDKLERLEKKATPGPWEAAKCGPAIWRGPLEVNEEGHTQGADKSADMLIEFDPFNYESRSRSEEGAERLAMRDCRFIAAMRNAIVELIAEAREVERLRVEIARLQEQNAKLQADLTYTWTLISQTPAGER